MHVIKPYFLELHFTLDLQMLTSSLLESKRKLIHQRGYLLCRIVLAHIMPLCGKLKSSNNPLPNNVPCKINPCLQISPVEVNIFLFLITLDKNCLLSSGILLILLSD